MTCPIFELDTRAGTFTIGNAEAEKFAAGWPKVAGGWPLDTLCPMPQATALIDGCARWLRLPSGQRTWTALLTIPAPESPTRAHLVFRPGSEAELDATVFQSFSAALLDDENGAATLRTLGEICEVMRSSLGLALVRTCHGDDFSAVECLSRGDPQVAVAARNAVEPLVAMNHGSTPKSGSTRYEVRTFKPDAAPADGALRSLYHCGVRSVMRVPLAGSDQRFILEFFAYGADDFSETQAQGFFDRWIPWLERTLNTSQRRKQDFLLAGALDNASDVAFLTDPNGAIVWINKAFTSRYGYAPDQAIGRTPRILQSGKHGALYYDRLWAALRSGRSWNGETVDRTAEDKLVTVRQSITPLRQGREITHFLSIHSDLTNEAELSTIEDRQKETDVLTGLLTAAAFEERCRELLTTALESRLTPAVLVMAVQTRSGGAPQLDAEALAFTRSELGERIRSIIGETIAAGALTDFDFAFLIPHPGARNATLERDLSKMLGEPLPFLGDSLQLTCRFSQAQYPLDGRDFDSLRRCAEDRFFGGPAPTRATTVRPGSSSTGS